MKADLQHPTQYKFRHYSPDETGRQYLIWASDIGEFQESDRIYRGSAKELEVIREQLWIPNALMDGGENAILDVFFRAGTAPTFYFGLYNDTPIDTDTPATLAGEVTGTGYARISVARNTTDWPSLALDSGDYKVTSATKTFTAAGSSWSQATSLVLVSSGPAGGTTTGVAYAWAALSQTRQLGDGDSLDVTMGLKAA